MDNGTANATMVEVARIISSRAEELKRSVRFAFGQVIPTEDMLLLLGMQIIIGKIYMKMVLCMLTLIQLVQKTLLS